MDEGYADQLVESLKKALKPGGIFIATFYVNGFEADLESKDDRMPGNIVKRFKGAGFDIVDNMNNGEILIFKIPKRSAETPRVFENEPRGSLLAVVPASALVMLFGLVSAFSGAGEAGPFIPFLPFLNTGFLSEVEEPVDFSNANAEAMLAYFLQPHLRRSRFGALVTLHWECVLTGIFFTLHF